MIDARRATAPIPWQRGWHRVRWIPIAAVIGMVVSMASVSAQTGDESARWSESIANAIGQLDSPKFEQRRDATRSLIRAGQASVEPLHNALNGHPSVELQTRALQALESIAEEEFEIDGGAAFRALKDLSETRLGPIGRRSGVAVQRLKVAHRNMAYRKLAELGAVLQLGWVQQAVGAPLRQGVREIQIGEKWRGTEADARWLSRLGSVQRIVLQGKFVTLAYIEPLLELDTVGDIEIRRASLDENVLDTLLQLSDCRRMSLLYTPVGDGAIEQLSNLRVAELRLYGTAISPEGHAALVKSLAGACALDFRAGGFLGVGPATNGPTPGVTGFVVGKVEPNSAAHRAGLRVGDRILKYDGHSVKSFDQVRELIGRNEVGQKVQVVYKRNTKELETTLALGEWP